MSRDIKFRIYDTDEKEMFYQEDIDYIDFFTGIVFIREEDGYDYLIDSRSDGKLMQYTGLKDKNGKEIYEGDILHVTKVSMCGVDKYNVAEYNTDVRWEDGAFVIKGDADVDCYDTWLASYNNPDSPQIEIEVIGNIYENPELLEGES